MFYMKLSFISYYHQPSSFSVAGIHGILGKRKTLLGEAAEADWAKSGCAMRLLAGLATLDAGYPSGYPPPSSGDRNRPEVLPTSSPWPPSPARRSGVCHLNRGMPRPPSRPRWPPCWTSWPSWPPPTCPSWCGSPKGPPPCCTPAGPPNMICPGTIAAKVGQC